MSKKRKSLLEKVSEQKRTKVDFSEFPSAAYASTDEGKHDELSDAQSRDIWRQWYGGKSKALCAVCGVTQIKDTTAGYDRAHVVARRAHGRNSACWNRVATCRTCNAEDRGGNLLDYVYVNYRRHLYRVCSTLFSLYCTEHPQLFEYLECMPLSEFVRRVFYPSLVHRSAIASTLDTMQALKRSYDDMLAKQKRLEHEEQMAVVAVQDAKKELHHARLHLDTQRSKTTKLQIKLEKFIHLKGSL